MTTVRLAYNPGPVNAYKALEFREGESLSEKRDPDSPTVRLAATTAMLGCANGSGTDRYPFHKEAAGPSVRLAMGNSPAERNGTTGFEAPAVRLAINGAGQGETNGAIAADLRPALLVSYYYLKPFLKNRARYHYRDWVMDSGAFSAHNSGVEIKLQDYIDCCKQLMASDPTLTEIFALDVIGDWRAGVRNCEEMWRQGIPAIPCFHYGEPWDLLKGLARDYPKIALGGCVGRRDKDKFAGDCFARVWPKAMHGFGFGAEKSILMYPWHSVDATNWEIGPCAFGRWNAYGKMSVRGSKQNLRKEVEWYLDLEKRARWRWRKEMGQLKGLEPTVRLATDCRAAGGGRQAGRLGVERAERSARSRRGVLGQQKVCHGRRVRDTAERDPHGKVGGTASK